MRIRTAVFAVVVFLVVSASAQRNKQTVPAQTAPVSTQPSLKADEVLNSIPFRLVGPASPAGRVWHITGVPQQPKTLFVCTADADEPAVAIEAKSGAIETLDAPAPAPGAGLP